MREKFSPCTKSRAGTNQSLIFILVSFSLFVQPTVAITYKILPSDRFTAIRD